MSIRMCPCCGYSLAAKATDQLARVYERVRKDGAGRL